MSIDVAKANQEGDIRVMSEWRNWLLWHLLLFLHSWIFSATKSDILTDGFPLKTKIACSDTRHSLLLIVRVTASKLAFMESRVWWCALFFPTKEVLLYLGCYSRVFTCYLRFSIKCISLFTSLKLALLIIFLCPKTSTWRDFNHGLERQLVTKCNL